VEKKAWQQSKSTKQKADIAGEYGGELKTGNKEAKLLTASD